MIRLGIPHATSTIWMARRTLPRASSIVFPFSRVRMRATSSACFSSSSLYR